MSKKEIGEIIQVNFDSGEVEYRVRLPNCGVVYFPHTLVRPVPIGLLARSTRLLIEHDRGMVLTASTNLSFTRTGFITEVKVRAGTISYVVDIPQGGIIEIVKDKVQPHPEKRNLLIGAMLEFHFDAEKLTIVRLMKENDLAKITNINLEQRTAAILGKHTGRFTVRLAPEEVRRLAVGDVVDMEISYTAEGKQKLLLARKQPTQQSSSAQSEPRTADQSNQSRGTHSSSDKSTSSATSHPQSDLSSTESIEAETIGLDALILKQLKRAGHRFEIVSFLEKHAGDGLIQWYELKNGCSAKMREPTRPLEQPIQWAINKAMPEFQGLYLHQALALDTIRQNRNLVVVTQTASGKTLSYNPAIFEYLLSNPHGHVLYIFPLNALMMDQLEKIRAMVQALEKQGAKITSAHMIGGMDPAERDAVARECPNIVVTNPEMLNFLLDRADRDWRVFFADLKIIVIDEVHSYRGIFGVHMTGIVRRLLIVARRLGSDPRFVISSATVNNPKDLAARLTAIPEDDFDLLSVDQDGSQQADKHWLALNPDWGARNVGRYNNYQEVAADVFVEMLLCRDAAGRPSPLHTIMFCRSMREVRAIKNLVDQRLDQKGPHLKEKVKSYISANLTIEVKREIYNGLRSDKLLGVISTNALEAGIDIGSLDACIIAGFPFSVMALRQMAGRVGRKKEGIVCFIPFPLSSLDQYYSDHPDLFLTQPPEEFVVDPHNPYIARKHINAAAYPAGITEEELRRYWGKRAVEIVHQAKNDRVINRFGDRWIGTKRDYRVKDDEYQIGNIRSNVQVPFVVCRAVGECAVRPECFDQNKRTCENRITLMDRQYVYRDCHPGAVYDSPDQGLFRVLSIDETNRTVTAEPLPETCLERTFVEADIDIKLTDSPQAKKEVIHGVEMTWGKATVTRLFTGYYEYTLQPARRCRSCRKEFDETVNLCPHCNRPTERIFNQSKPARKEFSDPYQQGFRIVLKTVASWMTIHPQIESLLNYCSPCKLPGEQNRVLAWLMRPLNLNTLPGRLSLSDEEKKEISDYHQQAAARLVNIRPTKHETVLFPGIFEQCLLAALRKMGNESRALELFEAITSYPVTNDLRQICRNCCRSVLLPAMHTLEHAVDARYPSVALGDRSDIGALTTLGHSATGLPTIFWFDNYEGGLGAAEKIYELILRLLESGLKAIQSCTCMTLEGCPRCTYIPDCANSNTDLSKPAGILLISMLLGREVAKYHAPFIYKKKRSEEFNKAYKDNETAASEQGLGEEAPASAPKIDPYQILRIQRKVHAPVINKALEVRSREIVEETPPLSALQLNQAYQSVVKGSVLVDWQARGDAKPYEILEVLPNASMKMIQQVYRVIALHVHPDTNPSKKELANEMMKQLNAAYQVILKEKNDHRK